MKKNEHNHASEYEVLVRNCSPNLLNQRIAVQPRS